jgi:hypothetical protein
MNGHDHPILDTTPEEAPDGFLPTHALEPLEPWPIQESDLPETYPSAH